MEQYILETIKLLALMQQRLNRINKINNQKNCFFSLPLETSNLIDHWRKTRFNVKTQTLMNPICYMQLRTVDSYQEIVSRNTGFERIDETFTFPEYSRIYLYSNSSQKEISNHTYVLHINDKKDVFLLVSGFGCTVEPGIGNFQERKEPLNSFQALPTDIEIFIRCLESAISLP